MIKQKSFEINRYSYDSQVISHTNTWWEYMFRFALGLHFVMDDANEVNTAGGWYGDACISEGSFRIHNDLILSVGWGDGFAIRRVNNDGTFTNIYYDNSPANSYHNYQSLAIDKTRKIAYVGNHVYNNLTLYDYSQCIGGDDTVTKLGQKTKANDGLPADEVGYDYFNGLEVIGDYLYMTSDDFYTNQVLRWNVTTETAENINVINLRNTGEHGGVWYDSINNRLYIWWQYNGEYWVVLNPDKSTTDATNPAKAYNLRVRDLIGTDDMYSGGVIIDSNNPNHIWINANYGRLTKIDITNVLNETATVPTLLYVNDIVKYTSGYKGCHLNGKHQLVMHPLYSDMGIVTPDRGWWRNFGWLDQEHGLAVGPSTPGWGHYDGVNKHRYTMVSNSNLVFDYGGIPKLITTTDGSQYLVHGGYGGDGYKFRSWTIDKFKLYNSGNIVFGNYAFDDNTEIRAVQLQDIANHVYVLTDTSILFEVSNNNGSTWEVYDWQNEEMHHFNSTGNSVRLKITLTGTDKKSSHIMTQHEFPKVHIYGGEFYNHISPNISQSFKIRGI